jgi:hypothetical protein
MHVMLSSFQAIGSFSLLSDFSVSPEVLHNPNLLR